MQYIMSIHIYIYTLSYRAHEICLSQGRSKITGKDVTAAMEKLNLAAGIESIDSKDKPKKSTSIEY